MSSEISTLTDAQEKILSILPILPSLASSLCSGAIIYLVIRSRFESPYKRILFAMSVADIITSVSFAFQPFLVPKATSQRVWAIGNDATCTALGTFAQLSACSVWYNGILSYYYLLTIRFGIKEKTFAKRFEPIMHALATGWPLVTSIVGAVLGVYHETELGAGCWISDYPEGCMDDTGECKSPLIAWIFAGIWAAFMLVSIVLNNIIIYRYVRKLLMQSMRSSMVQVTQTKRIHEVATQATLYVLAFTCTFIWTVVLRIMESLRFDAEDEAHLFPLLVIQNIMVPSTGVFNLIVYLWPRYIRVRASHTNASPTWVFRRALYGESIREPLESQQSSQTSGWNERSFLASPSEKFQSLWLQFKSSKSGRNNISTMTPDTWKSENRRMGSMRLDDLIVDEMTDDIASEDAKVKPTDPKELKKLELETAQLGENATVCSFLHPQHILEVDEVNSSNELGDPSLESSNLEDSWKEGETVEDVWIDEKQESGEKPSNTDKEECDIHRLTI